MIRRNKTYGGFAKLFEKTTKENPQTALYSDNLVEDVDNGVTAATGSTQATGYKVTKSVTVIGTCGNAGDSLTLPQETKVGKGYKIKNNGANSSDIFPPVGGDIDGGGANAAVAVANTKSALFVCTSYESATPTSTWASFFTD